MPIIGFDNLDIATKSAIISSKVLATWDGPSARYTPVAGDRVTRVEFYGGTDAADVGRIALQVISTGMLVCKTDVYYTPGTGKRWNSVDVDYDLSPYEGEELRVVFMFTGSALTEDPYFSTNVLPDDATTESTALYGPARANPSNVDWPDWYTGSFISSLSLGSAPVRMVVESGGPTLSGAFVTDQLDPPTPLADTTVTADIYTTAGVFIGSVEFTTNAAGAASFTHASLEYSTDYRVGLRNAGWTSSKYVLMTTSAEA